MKKMRYFLIFLLNTMLTLSILAEENKADPYFDSGYAHYIHMDYGKALKCFLDFIKTEKSNPKPRQTKIALMHRYRGQCFKQLEMFAHAINEFHLALDIYTHENDSAKICLSQNELGKLFSEEGKFEQAEIFFEEALVNLGKMKWLSNLQTTYLQLAKIKFREGDYKVSDRLFARSLNLNNEYGMEFDPTYIESEVFYYQAQIKFSQNNTLGALKILNKAEQHCRLLAPELIYLHELLIDIKLKKAEIYIQEDKDHQAFSQIEQAKQIAKKYELKDHEAKVGLALAKIYQQSGELENASKIITPLMEGFNLAKELKSNIPNYYLEFLQLALTEFQINFKKTNDFNFLVEKLEMIEHHLGFFSQVSSGILFLSDKKNRDKPFKPFYDDAIETAVALFHQTNDETFLKRAFQYTEAFRFNSLVQESSRAFNTTADEVRESEQIKIAQKKQEINDLLSRLDLEKDENRRGRRELIKLLNEYEKSRWELNEQRITGTVSLRDDFPALLKKQLTHDELYLKFFSTENKIYQFLISSAGFEVNEIILDSVFMQNLELYSRFVSNPEPGNTTINDLRRYCQSSYYLYSKLFKPFVGNATLTDIIVESGTLMKNIPLDALLVSDILPTKVNMSQYPFLIRNCNITYSGSVQLYLESVKQKKYPKAIHYAGFAPFAKSDKNHSELNLNSSGEEVLKSADILGGDVFLDSEASKKKLFSVVEKSNILHLATHARSHPIHPQLAELNFVEPKGGKLERLYYYEILNREWDCSLMILGACGSSVGEFIVNYGTISLANAFQNSGVTGIVGANWKVDDVVSAKMIPRFCNYINDGEEVSTALRKSKLNFIKESGDIFSHPHYWGVYTYQGSKQIIRDRESKWEYYFGGAVVVGLIFFFYFVKKRKGRWVIF